MGKPSHRSRNKEAATTNMCPVCWEAIGAKDETGVADDALSCPNGHNLCLGCVRRLVEPLPKCSPECSGLRFTCPLCRADCCVNKIHMLEVEARAIDREIRILKQSVHQHVIKLYEVIDSPTNYYLVMECAAHGDLAGHLERKGRLREAEAAKYLVQTVSGIAHCHARGAIHRDIKPENLLLDANYDIKVTDFGLSAIIKPGQLLKVACGTPSYSAPEVIARKEYDGTLTDVWSLGVLLYHLTHGCLPFNSTQEIKQGEYKPSGECIPPAALELLRTMLVVNPEQRASLNKVSAHPWMVQWRPHALREPKRRFGLTHDVPDAELVAHIEDKFGLRGEHVEASLKGGLYNHATATYSLLEEMRP